MPQPIVRTMSESCRAIFVAEQPVRVGIVNCGYADGYPRVAPTGTPVVVDGVRTRTLGRVSMDMLEAKAALHDPPDTFTWWTDLVLLDQPDRTTMQLAVTLASELNGVLRIRK